MKPNLWKVFQLLHFRCITGIKTLQQLHLIELIRSGQVEEALSFAQDHLSEAGESDPAVLNELERTLALLAFEEPTQSPFSDLLLPTHRQKVKYHCSSSFTNILIYDHTF